MIAYLIIGAVLLALLLPQQKEFEQSFEDWKAEQEETDKEWRDYVYTNEINRNF